MKIERTPPRTSPKKKKIMEPSPEKDFDFESNILYSYAQPQSPLHPLDPELLAQMEPYRPKPKKRTRLIYELVPSMKSPSRSRSRTTPRTLPSSSSRSSSSTGRRSTSPNVSTSSDSEESIEPTQVVDPSTEQNLDLLRILFFEEQLKLSPFKDPAFNKMFIQSRYSEQFKKFVADYLDK
jgi:hypothetical protein